MIKKIIVQKIRHISASQNYFYSPQYQMTQYEVLGTDRTVQNLTINPRALAKR